MSRKKAKKELRRLNRDASQLRGTGEAIGAGVTRTGTFFLGTGVQQTLPLRGSVAACGGAVLPGRSPVMMGMFQADPGALEYLTYDECNQGIEVFTLFHL